MIEKLAARTAFAIKKIVPDHPASEPVLKYALEGIYNATFIILFSIGISMGTGNLKEALILLVSFPLLRQITGGLHLKSSVACVIVTTAVVSLLSYVRLNQSMMTLSAAVSLILVLSFAPSRIEKQSRIPREYYPTLKLLGSILIVISYFVHSSALTIAFLIQSLTLIPPLVVYRREVKGHEDDTLH